MIAEILEIKLNPQDITPPGKKGHLPKGTEVSVVLGGRTDEIRCKANGYSSITSREDAFLNWFNSHMEGDELIPSVDDKGRLHLKTEKS